MKKTTTRRLTSNCILLNVSMKWWWQGCYKGKCQLKICITQSWFKNNTPPAVDGMPWNCLQDLIWLLHFANDWKIGDIENWNDIFDYPRYDRKDDDDMILLVIMSSLDWLNKIMWSNDSSVSSLGGGYQRTNSVLLDGIIHRLQLVLMKNQFKLVLHCIPLL